MRNFLLTTPTPLLLLIVVGGSAALALAATHIVRSRIREEVHQANNEVAGFIFAAVAVIYGVLLAFIVLVVWQTVQDAQVTVETEANTLVRLFRLGQELPEPFSEQIQTSAIEYAELVVNDEWSAMSLERQSARVDATLESMWAVQRAFDASQVEVGNEEFAYFNTLAELGDQRRIRLLQSRSELPTLMWMLLIGGGILTLGFTLFFRAPNYFAHMLMAAMFAGLVAFVLVLIIELDTPFWGEVRIEPNAYLQAIDLFTKLRAP